MALKSGLLPRLRQMSGPAFLMATAAIGPGFITQTTVFTGSLYTSFGFVILVSILLDIIVQLNIWRIIAASGLRAPALANKVFPYLGHVLVVLVAGGGLVFNIGNMGGAGLAVQSLTGLPLVYGALGSAVLAVLLFATSSFGRFMDAFVKIAGIVMIGLMVYVVAVTNPPWSQMALHTVAPQKIDFMSIITLVGGTVGGYICFSGAHRLLDAGINGPAQMQSVNTGAVSGILLAGIMRVLLFAAVAGVVASGIQLPAENPAEAVFGAAAGRVGRVMFGIILWAASLTSIVAAAYTSVSFLQASVPVAARHPAATIRVFIALSACIFIIWQKPTTLLVWAGTLNGLVLPISLAVVLIAARKTIAGYSHSKWLQVTGWLVAILLGYMSVQTIVKWIF